MSPIATSWVYVSCGSGGTSLSFPRTIPASPLVKKMKAIVHMRIQQEISAKIYGEQVGARPGHQPSPEPSEGFACFCERVEPIDCTQKWT